MLGLALRIRPGFFTLHHMDRDGVGLAPAVLVGIEDVIDPGKHLKAIAPLVFAACRAVKVRGLQRSKLFPHIRQTAGGQDNHEVPVVGTASMEYRPIRIEPIHDQAQSPLPKPAFEPFGEATKGLEFAILLRFGIGVRNIFAKFRRQGEREPIAGDEDRFQDIRSIPIGIHRPGHFLPRGFVREWLVAHQCLGSVDRHHPAMIDYTARGSYLTI